MITTVVGPDGTEYEELEVLSILVPPDVTEDHEGWLFTGEVRDTHELGVDVYRRKRVLAGP